VLVENRRKITIRHKRQTLLCMDVTLHIST